MDELLVENQLRNVFEESSHEEVYILIKDFKYAVIENWGSWKQYWSYIPI